MTVDVENFDAGWSGFTPGQIIRARREELGLTQAQLAERVGHIDAAGVSKIETGVTKLGRARATRFASALSVSVNLLLPLAEPTPTNRDLADRLELIASEIELLAGNQERLVEAIERLADPAQQVGEHE